jgi:hypothetical protein
VHMPLIDGERPRRGKAATGKGRDGGRAGDYEREAERAFHWSKATAMMISMPMAICR